MVNNREIPVIRNRTDTGIINQFELFRSKLGVVSEFEKQRLGIRGGVKVLSNLSGKLAQRTHMCSGFVICTINDQTINTIQDFQNAIENKKGVMLSGVYPDGRMDRYYLQLV